MVAFLTQWVFGVILCFIVSKENFFLLSAIRNELSHIETKLYKNKTENPSIPYPRALY
jgi:quinol-cytochrome oxidoreductase complex cytochrome b subunit